jgi:hypothetical protein
MVWTGLSSSGQGPVEGSSEHGNEPSGPIKHWEILGVAERLAASQEGLSSTELVTFLDSRQDDKRF